MNYRLFDIPLALVSSSRIDSSQNVRVCFTRGNGAQEANRAGVFAGGRVCSALLRPETPEPPMRAALAVLRQARRLLFLRMFVSVRAARLNAWPRLPGMYRLRAAQAGKERKHSVRCSVKNIHATCIAEESGVLRN